MLLLILQRYYFESESQQTELSKQYDYCCCLSYKDTILKANHSTRRRIIRESVAVAYPTKILFWKRITATAPIPSSSLVLLLILQRYYFESESQLGGISSGNLGAVAYPTKILFWKRITAEVDAAGELIMLLLILQRYYFESESQPLAYSVICRSGCCLSYKDTILKANHSFTLRIHEQSIAVAYPTKILFWKRITA